MVGPEGVREGVEEMEEAHWLVGEPRLGVGLAGAAAAAVGSEGVEASDPLPALQLLSIQ